MKTTDHDDEEVEEFYAQLENTISKTPKKDIIIVQGDWNAQVGPDAHQQWAGTVGRFCIGETNDRGMRQLEFASSHKLILANTLHPCKLSRITTWHAPTGLVHNQIDYILTLRRFKSSINKAKTRTYSGTDVGSDHDVVLMVMKLKLNKLFHAPNPRIKFDLEKLNDPEIASVFKAEVGGRFAALNLVDSSFEELAGDFKEVVLESAEEILGRRRKKIQPWVTNDILDLCDKRRSLES